MAKAKAGLFLVKGATDFEVGDRIRVNQAHPPDHDRFQGMTGKVTDVKTTRYDHTLTRILYRVSFLTGEQAFFSWDEIARLSWFDRLICRIFEGKG